MTPRSREQVDVKEIHASTSMAFHVLSSSMLLPALGGGLREKIKHAHRLDRLVFGLPEECRIVRVACSIIVPCFPFLYLWNPLDLSFPLPRVGTCGFSICLILACLG